MSDELHQSGLSSPHNELTVSVSTRDTSVSSFNPNWIFSMSSPSGSAEATEAEKELENIVAALMKNIDKDVDKESTGTKEITSRADENKRTSSKRSRDDDGDKETPQKKRVKFVNQTVQSLTGITSSIAPKPAARALKRKDDGDQALPRAKRTKFMFVDETDNIIQNLTGRPASNGQKRTDEKGVDNAVATYQKQKYEHATLLPRGRNLLSIRGYFGGPSPSAREVAVEYGCSSNTAIKAETKAIRDLFNEKLGLVEGEVEAGKFLEERRGTRSGKFIQGALSYLDERPSHPPIPKPVKSRKRCRPASPSTTGGDTPVKTRKRRRLESLSTTSGDTPVKSRKRRRLASLSTTSGVTEQAGAEDQAGEEILPSSNTIVDDTSWLNEAFDHTPIPRPVRSRKRCRFASPYITGGVTEQAGAEDLVAEESLPSSNTTVDNALLLNDASIPPSSMEAPIMEAPINYVISDGMPYVAAAPFNYHDFFMQQSQNIGDQNESWYTG